MSPFGAQTTHKRRRPSGRKRRKNDDALVAELVDARDLKSLPTQVGCRFNSCRGHKSRSIDRFFYFYFFTPMIIPVAHSCEVKYRSVRASSDAINRIAFS